MSVYKPRKSPFFHYAFAIQGRRFHGTTGTANRRDAEAFERLRKEEARAAIAAEAGHTPMTVDMAFGRYWTEVGQHHRRPDQTEWSLEWLLARLGKDTPVASISNDDVARLVAERRGERAANSPKGATRPVTPSTVNRSVTEPLRKVLTRARDLWGVRVQRIEWKRHLLREPPERVRSLSQEEEDRLFAVLPAAYHPPIRFALALGFRLSEVVGLRWSAVDWGARTITVTGKGGKTATVPLTPGVRAILWPLRGQHPERAFCRPARPREAHGGPFVPITVPGIDTAFGRALERAKIEGFRFHDLRHTTATRLLRETGNLRLAQRLLRHADLATTARYAHIGDDDLRAALEGMEGNDADATRRRRGGARRRLLDR